MIILYYIDIIYIYNYMCITLQYSDEDAEN